MLVENRYSREVASRGRNLDGAFRKTAASCFFETRGKSGVCCRIERKLEEQKEGKGEQRNIRVTARGIQFNYLAVARAARSLLFHHSSPRKGKILPSLEARPRLPPANNELINPRAICGWSFERHRRYTGTNRMKEAINDRESTEIKLHSSVDRSADATRLDFADFLRPRMHVCG